MEVKHNVDFYILKGELKDNVSRSAKVWDSYTLITKRAWFKRTKKIGIEPSQIPPYWLNLLYSDAGNNKVIQ